jgi:hypothetical protein
VIYHRRPEIRQHQNRLRLWPGHLRFHPPWLALAKEVDVEIFLLLLVCFPVRGGTEFLVLELAQGADLLSAVKAFHAINFIE